jgi:hypothetical protein
MKFVRLIVKDDWEGALEGEIVVYSKVLSRNSAILTEENHEFQIALLESYHDL